MSDSGPKEERQADGKGLSRRKFLREGLGLAGAGLVHFTILGSLATPAHADPILNDNCCTTNDTADVCDCYSGDVVNAEGKQRDLCACDADKNVVDLCNCGGESESDRCGCPEDQQEADKCDGTGGEGNSVDYCGCGVDQSVADKCTCKTDRYEGADPKDYCACWTDAGTADSCDCGTDKGTSGAAADACACWNDKTNNADSCTAGGQIGSWGCDSTKLDYHEDPNASADACQCTQDGSQVVDACKCWWDGYATAGDGVADYCDCPGDKSGKVDSCACCFEGSQQADKCDCDKDSGSICYDEGGFPAFADWCNTQNDNGADLCNCGTGDYNTDSQWPKQNSQADICYNDYHPPASTPSAPGSGDLCDPGADSNKGAQSTDYCGDSNSPPLDACKCDGDAGVADICEKTQDSNNTVPENSTDYCRPGQGVPEDICECPGDAGVADV